MFQGKTRFALYIKMEKQYTFPGFLENSEHFIKMGTPSSKGTMMRRREAICMSVPSAPCLLVMSPAKEQRSSAHLSSYLHFPPFIIEKYFSAFMFLSKVGNEKRHGFPKDVMDGKERPLTCLGDIRAQ